MKLAHAFRSLARAPALACAAVLTLALGIGASTAVFSVVHGVLLRPLPYPEANRIVQLWQVFETSARGQLSHPNFEDIRGRSRSFEALAQYGSGLVSISSDREPVRRRRAVVSREFFDVLGVVPVAGRTFVEEELRTGGARVALVSYGFWKGYLGGRELRGASLRLGRDVYQVVGVLPPGFSFPADTDLWIPREQIPPVPSRTAHNWYAIGKLREGVSLERARADVSTVARELRETHGEDTWMVDAALVPLREELTAGSRPALLVLLGAVGFLLLVAVANVVHLLAARALAREREIVVTAALGAGRWALVEPFLLEAGILSLAGGLLGVGLAYGAVKVLLAFAPESLPRTGDIGVSVEMLGFALALSLLTALALGLACGIRAARLAARGSLHDAERSAGARGEGGRLGRGLVVAEIALTFVLLVGAGLLAKSLYRLLAVDPGFHRSGALVLELSFPVPTGEPERRELGRTHERLLRALGSLPGVAHAGGVDRLPMAAGFRGGTFLKLGENDSVESVEHFARLAKDPERLGEAEYRAASPGFFETLGIPLIRGRLFEARDDSTAPHVAIVSESLAAAEWPSGDPLGKRIEFGNMDGDLRVMRIVGVVGDVRHGGLDSEARGTIYVNALQRPPAGFTVVMDVAGHPEAILPAARRLVRELAPDVPPRFRSLEQVIEDSVASRRFVLSLVGVFASAALLLALIGIYGVLSYGVSGRRAEIGVRVALGASPEKVLGLIAGEGLRITAVGILIGVAAALGLSRLLESMLFEVSPSDPLTFLGLSSLVAAAALAACLLPALRAARLDPRVALHAD